jgi:hypothetical protein
LLSSPARSSFEPPQAFGDVFVAGSAHKVRPAQVEHARLARPQFFGGAKCQERAGVAQRFGAGRLLELGEVYDSACAGESVGNDRLTLLAQLEGDDERWSAQLHAPPKISATRLTKRAIV